MAGLTTNAANSRLRVGLATRLNSTIPDSRGAQAIAIAVAGRLQGRWGVPAFKP